MEAYAELLFWIALYSVSIGLGFAILFVRIIKLERYFKAHKENDRQVKEGLIKNQETFLNIIEEEN